MGQHCVDCVAQANAAQRGTAPTVARRDSKPVVTYTLIAINVLVFGAVMLQAGGTGTRDLLSSTIYTNGVLVNGGGFDNQYWRLLTSGFLHQSVPHLALNMFSLYIIGADLERVLGRARYLAIYLVGLLGGSAAIMALQQEPTLTAGASGAIYGLMGALFVILVRLKAPLTTVIVIIVVNILFSVTVPNVSILGHLGGLVFGAASAAVVVWLPTAILPPIKRTQAAVDRIGWYGLIVLAVVALAIGAGIGLGASV
ncbi:rhomboid family intramembrane serine protease [Gordonia sp. (in: high G+C Gram-positive bacteria)]|uniref:rhomboid family intramembrane serine protease n=1 Tax=Gordonia sp. (in: high G+C Gram-positive bacteria) TaxID=84139 RepID=UPI003F9A8333